jgi:DNA mismatch repair protein MutL
MPPSVAPVWGTRTLAPASTIHESRGASFPAQFSAGFSAQSPSLSGGIKAFEPSSTLQFEPPVTQIPWGQLHFLGSVSKCYLLSSDGDQLLAVDQHAWHERIIFERLSRDRSLLNQSQQLMIPESNELPAADIDALRAGRAFLLDNGFSFEIQGDTTLDVTGMPVILAHRDPGEMLSLLAKKGFGEAVTAELGQDLLATFACHSAVRAGEELGPDELRRLLGEASEVDFQHNCPHGRRVFRWWDASQIGRWFDR